MMMAKSGEDSEPKENDKCINSGAHDSGGGGGGDHGNGASVEPTFEKTNKTRKDVFAERVVTAKKAIDDNHNCVIVLLCILVLVLLLITIGLAVYAGKLGSDPVEEQCLSSPCLRAASSIVASLESSTKPCDDIWSYTCKGWIDRHPVPENKGRLSVKDLVRTEINHEFRNLMDLVTRTDDLSPDWKVKQFYSACMDLQEIEYSSENLLKHKITSIGGWRLLNSYSSSMWDKTKVLQRLLVDFGVTPYFRIFVDTDDMAPKSPVIKIEPSGLGLPHRDYYYNTKYEKLVGGYKQFMKDLAKQFGATSLHANSFSQDMYAYEKRIAEVTPKLEDWSDPSVVYKKYRIRELQTLAPSFKWNELLQAYFDGVPIKDSTTVLVAFPKYFKDISNVVSTTDNDAINNYMMWKLTSAYASYLPKAFRVISNEFSQLLNGVQGSKLAMAEDRWEYCFGVTSNFMSYALSSMYIRAKHPNLEHASSIVNNITSTLLRQVDNLNWISDQRTKEGAQTKIRGLVTLTGYPEFLNNEKIVRDYYNDMSLQNNLFNNILEGVNFLRRKQAAWLKDPTNPNYIWSISPHDPTATYKYAGNQMQIGFGLLRQPIFDEQLPLAMKFGSLGFHVSAEIMKSVSLKGVHYDFFGKLIENPMDAWISESADSALNVTTECLFEELLQQSVSDRDLKFNANISVNNAFTDITALRLAFNSYKEYSRKYGEEPSLPGVSRNNDQLFFISFAQSLCESVSVGYRLAYDESRTTLPAEERIKFLFSQLPEFRNAFQCSRQNGDGQVCKI